MNTMFSLVLLWGGYQTTPPVVVPQPYLTEAKCAEAGDAWVAAKTRFTTSYVCIPAGFVFR